MCGIFGIAARRTNVSREMLERVAQSLAHRGPDDSGMILIRDADPYQVGLVHRRLAILDLSASGHQPMEDPATGNWIVFNGEIYNYRELRERLRGDGWEFLTNSDTEVLLKAYAAWGEACLDRLRGMYSFAIWDFAARRLFMARDPMGVKPFYFAARDDCFVFASEVRALLQTGFVRRELDPAGLANYLQFGSVYDPNAIIQGISSLRPGHSLSWQCGSLDERAFWDLPTVPERGRSREDLEGELEAQLHKAVCMQTVSDVPLGVFLSGGIDSTSLVAILRGYDAKVSTFSIVFNEEDYTEETYSRLVSRIFGTDHHELRVSEDDVFEAIPDFLSAIDQPSIDGLNTYIISREAQAAGIKVALHGVGGDELFAGYSSFFSVPRMERFLSSWNTLPKFVRRSAAKCYELASPRSDQNRKLAELARENGRLIHSYFLSRSLFTRKQRDALLTCEDALTRAYAPLHASLAATERLDPINQVSYLEARCYMLNTLLRDADVMSMAHGLELRVPLADHKLAEAALALPGSSKVSPDQPKPLLLKAVQRQLPAEIVHRRKRGFTFPFEQWMRGRLKPEIQGTLRRIEHGPLSSVLDTGAVQQTWLDFCQGKTSWSRPWSLYLLQRWCELQSITA